MGFNTKNIEDKFYIFNKTAYVSMYDTMYILKDIKVQNIDVTIDNGIQPYYTLNDRVEHRKEFNLTNMNFSITGEKLEVSQGEDYIDVLVKNISTDKLLNMLYKKMKTRK